MRSYLRGLLVFSCLLMACQVKSPDSLADAGAGGSDAGMPPVTVGLLQDCAPKGVGYGDVLCAAGLRCSLVLVGDAPAQGALLQCVPEARRDEALAEGMPCSFDQELASPTEPTKHFDRCGAGFGCVPTPSQGLRCRRLCQLRIRSACSKSELCVEPTQVSGVGFCARPDKCQPVAPQSGCPLGTDGKQLGCYVLGDDKGTSTFCLAQQPYGAGKGILDDPCERAWNCEAGLGCVTPNSRGAICRPYCARPEVPDGGLPPDAGSGEVQCPGNLGTCHAISGRETVGRCY